MTSARSQQLGKIIFYSNEELMIQSDVGILKANRRFFRPWKDQRELDLARVKEIKSDIEKYSRVNGCLFVHRDDNTSYHIYDGQHRLEAIYKLSDKFNHIPVMIQVSIDYNYTCHNFQLVNKSVSVAEGYLTGRKEIIKKVVQFMEQPHRPSGLSWFPAKKVNSNARGNSGLLSKSYFENDIDQLLEEWDDDYQRLIRDLCNYNDYVIQSVKNPVCQSCNQHGCFLYVDRNGKTEYIKWHQRFLNWATTEGRDYT